jgi:hypothetical protein
MGEPSSPKGKVVSGTTSATHLTNTHPIQSPDIVVTVRERVGGDVERNSSSSGALQPDPFKLRHGLKTDDELAEIRRRRKAGKRVENYQRKQNDVRTCFLSPFDDAHVIPSSSLLC